MAQAGLDVTRHLERCRAPLQCARPKTRPNNESETVCSAHASAARPIVIPSSDRLQQFEQFAMHRLVPRNDRAALIMAFSTIEIADKPAGLTYQQQTSRHVPGRGCVPNSRQRGRPRPRRDRAPPSRTGAARQPCPARPQIPCGTSARSPRPRCGSPQANTASDEVAASRDAQPLVIEERALAALGGEQFVGDRIVDHPGDHRALALEPDRNAELRNAVQEIGRTVERIDDPGVGLVGSLATRPPSSPRNP